MFKMPGLLVCAALLVLPTSSRALIIFGDDESAHTSEPKNGAPAQYAAQIDSKTTAPASGVYLGNRFVLTAEHVTPPVRVRINGTDYPVDKTFTPRQIGAADLKLYRISGDPGLPPVTIIRPGEADTGKECVIFGWGVGKGAAIPGQGWSWGDDRTRQLRWGTNTTEAAYEKRGEKEVLVTTFDPKSTPGEAMIAAGDSGCPLFIQQGGKWKLAGIGVSVDTMGKCLYDADPAKPGAQPDRGYYLPLQLHYAALMAAMESR
jgi:hypothetical protein